MAWTVAGRVDTFGKTCVQEPGWRDLVLTRAPRGDCLYLNVCSNSVCTRLCTSGRSWVRSIGRVGRPDGLWETGWRKSPAAVLLSGRRRRL